MTTPIFSGVFLSGLRKNQATKTAADKQRIVAVVKPKQAKIRVNILSAKIKGRPSGTIMLFLFIINISPCYP
jgi:hypothetical protein